MEIYEKLLTYWQASSTLLEFFYHNNFKYIEITPAECNAGKITPSKQTEIAAVLENLPFPTELDIVIAPIILQQQNLLAHNNYHYLLGLQAKLTKNGEILPNKAQPLPWIPRILTEPTTTAAFSLASNEQCDQYYHFVPPPWGKDGPQSWQEQLVYANTFLKALTNDTLQILTQQHDYTILNCSAVIPLLNFKQNTLKTIAKKPQFWKKIVATRNSCPQQATPILNEEKAIIHSAHVNNNYALTKSQRAIITQALALNTNEILYLNAGPGTGKTTVIQDLIATLWIQAIIANTLPANIAIINNNHLAKMTILDCFPENTNTWLSKQQKLSCYYEDELMEPKSKIIANYLKQCSIEFNQQIDNLATAKIILRERVLLLYTALSQGIAAANAYNELLKKINYSYSSYGGISQRNKTIKELVDKQHSYYHYLKILETLWEKQVTPSSTWQKWLEHLPLIKQRKLERLQVFIKKHLPEAKVKNLTIKQMQEYLHNLLLQAEKKLHALTDIYQQITTDLQQLTIITNKLQRWLPEQMTKEFNFAKLMKSLDTHIRYRLTITAVHYWEAELLQQSGWESQDLFRDYYLNNNLPISQLIQHPVDWLFIEHGEYLSPIEGFYCIEGSQKIVVMGNPEAINFDKLPMAIEVNLLQQYGLGEFEEDIEDLQLAGLLMSNGKFSTFIEQHADYSGEQYHLSKQWDMAYKIVDCYNQFTHINKLQSCYQGKAKVVNNFTYLAIQGHKLPFLGSYYNEAEVTAIMQWIKENEATILANYPKNTFADTILICTPFYGQYLALQAACNKYNIAITIELLQTISQKRTPIVIFSPVYTKEDKGMLNFNQGEQLLRNLLLKVKESLLVFGDCQLFDKNLHSASGKFAKFLLETTKNELLCL